MPNVSGTIYDTKKCVKVSNVITRQTSKITKDIQDKISSLDSTSHLRSSKIHKVKTLSPNIKLDPEVTVEKESSNQHNSTHEKVREISSQKFLDSPEAKCWFGAGEKYGTIKNTMVSSIKHLQEAYMDSDGWIQGVEDNDQHDMCTSYDVFNIHVKSKYLSIALKFALDDRSTRTWACCCDKKLCE